MANYSIYVILLWVVLFAIRPIRKLALVLLPWAVFACLYDWMRLYPNYLLNTIDIRPLYETERQLFGITTEGGRMILGEWFNTHNAAWADLLAGLFYLCWMPVPLIYCLCLFFQGKRRQSLHFGVAFLWVNILGFIIYYVHPAAPPWYALEYGFTPQLDVPLTGAGLARFDALTGVSFFGNYYSGTSNIFAAVPSLHSAYVLTAAVYVLIFRDKWWKAALFFFITVGIWCTAVYTCHHYVIDVLLGILTALLAILILEQGLGRIPLFRKAFDAYATRL